MDLFHDRPAFAAPLYPFLSAAFAIPDPDAMPDAGPASRPVDPAAVVETLARSIARLLAEAPEAGALIALMRQPADTL